MIREPDRFDLNLLRAFVALWHESHMGRAAQVLGISQPALSAALKRLREHVGDPLFVKARHGMRPTAHAEQIAPEAVAILERVRHQLLAPPRFDPAQAQHTFTIATTDIGEMVFMPKLLRHLATAAPSVTVRTVTGVLPERLAAMARGDVDLLLGYYPDVHGADWMQYRLFEHGFVCLARQGHGAVRSGKIDGDAFLSASHADPRDPGRSRELVEAYLQNRGLRRRIVYVGAHFLSLPIVVASTDLIATVPAEVGRIFSGQPGLQQTQPPFPFPHFDVNMYWHSRAHHEAASRWLRDTLVMLFAAPVSWRRPEGAAE